MPWENAALTDDALQDFSAAAMARWEGVSDQAQAKLRLAILIAAGGIAVGVLGMASGLVAYVKTPVPEPPGYILVDKTTGMVTPPVPAKDAPILFPEATRQKALRDFIIACQSYIPQTWATLDYHACMLFATKEEQQRLADALGRATSPAYPPTLLGANGWAMPMDFPSYQPKGTVGDGPNQTFHYEVRYKRQEVVSGRPRFIWYVAEVYFQFHPELRMDPKDRAINPSGFQAISFSTVGE